MKRCSKCKEEKELTEFYRNKAKKDGLYSYCKPCSIKLVSKCNSAKYHNDSEWRKRHKEWHESKKDGFYSVYLLPDHNYVGSTHNLYQRMCDHRSAYNRNTDNYQILGKFKTHQEALYCESEYHLQGYEGGLSIQERIKLNKYLQCQS